MPETRRKYDPEFREGAVRIVRETGKPIAQVARGLRPPIDNVLSGRGAVDGEDVEELLHGDAELFVVAVDGGPV